MILRKRTIVLTVSDLLKKATGKENPELNDFRLASLKYPGIKSGNIAKHTVENIVFVSPKREVTFLKNRRPGHGKPFLHMYCA